MGTAVSKAGAAHRSLVERGLGGQPALFASLDDRALLSIIMIGSSSSSSSSSSSGSSSSSSSSSIGY